MCSKLDSFLDRFSSASVSDFHFTVVDDVLKVYIREDGVLSEVFNSNLFLDDLSDLFYCTDIKDSELNRDFSYVSAGGLRFRVNVFSSLTGVCASLRLIRSVFPSMDDLMLPNSIKNLCSLDHGLIIFSGPTGSGKSTSIASMLQFINSTRKKHIITIEEPIEYVYNSDLSLIQQREVGFHVNSFEEGLIASMREDPDIILIGEMRSYDTITTALNAAETGHLVFTTLHNNSVVEAIDRIKQFYSDADKNQICNQLANSFQAIVCQKLFKRKDNKGRVAAFEIMLRNPATINLIRTDQTYRVLSTLKSEDGMQTMEDSVSFLKSRNVI